MKIDLKLKFQPIFNWASVSYQFVWVAIFDFGRTDPTEATQSTAPPPPVVKFTNIRSTEFQVGWIDQDYCKEYNLQFIPAAEERIRKNRSSHRIANLKADTEYQAIVSCNVLYGKFYATIFICLLWRQNSIFLFHENFDF